LNNQDLEGFITCDELYQSTKSAFSNQFNNSKESLQKHDMTNLLRLELEKEFIDKLEEVTSYKENAKIRETYKFLFNEMIQEWSGPT